MYASGNVTEVISSPVTAEMQMQCINNIEKKIGYLYVHEVALVSCSVKSRKNKIAENQVENNY